MDEAVVLGLLEDGHGLVIGDVLAPAGFHDIGGHVAHGDAPALRVVAAALVQILAAGPAGAHALGVLALVLVQPIGDLLQAHGLVLRFDGLFHGDHVHADAGASGRHHGGDLFQGQEGHPLEEGRHLGMLVHLAAAHIEKLRAAGDELGQNIALFVVGVLPVQILPVILDQAHPGHVVQQLLQGLPLQLGQLHQLPDGLGLADAHLQGHVRHFVADQVRQAPVFRIVALDALELGGHPVGDHGHQLGDLGPGLLHHGDGKGQLLLLQGERGGPVAVDVLSHVKSPLSPPQGRFFCMNSP